MPLSRVLLMVHAGISFLMIRPAADCRAGLAGVSSWDIKPTRETHVPVVVVPDKNLVVPARCLPTLLKSGLPLLRWSLGGVGCTGRAACTGSCALFAYCSMVRIITNSLRNTLISFLTCWVFALFAICMVLVTSVMVPKLSSLPFNSWMFAIVPGTQIPAPVVIKFLYASPK